MGRRHPIISLLAILLTVIGLYSFAKSSQASPALSEIQQFATGPNEDRGGAGGAVVSNPQDSNSNRESSQSLKGTGSEHQTTNEVSRDAVDYTALYSGKPIMAKMPNQTIRAEVGRSGWKLLHTMLSQYPETPTAEERETLSTYIKLFSRVYPCRECAEHFQELLKKYPPQLATRQNAVMWGCQAHNIVNRRLGKKEFDCTYIFEEYDCGCGEAEGEKDEAATTESAPLQQG